MAAPCDESPLLIMMEYYRRPGDDVKKSSGRPQRSSLGEKPSRCGRKITDSRPHDHESLEISLSLLGRQERGLLEDMGGRRLVCHKRHLQVVGNTIDSLIIRDKGDALDRFRAAWADHRINLVNFPHIRRFAPGRNASG
jgi:hypothetical protein